MGFEYAHFARPELPGELAGVDLVNEATDQQLLSFLGDAQPPGDNTPPQWQAIADQSVVVNGEPFMDAGEHTGALPGRILRSTD